MTPQQAIANEILTLSGWSAGKVFWEAQNITRPSLPYIVLGRKTLSDRGILPEQIYSDNSSGVAGDPDAVPPTIGTELLSTVYIQQTLVVQASLFATSTVGSESADVLLDSIAKKLYLASSRARLDSSNVVFAYASDIQVIPSIVEARFEGRAVIDLMFRYVDSLSETETYIEQVSGTVTIDDGPEQAFSIDSIY